MEIVGAENKRTSVDRRQQQAKKNVCKKWEEVFVEVEEAPTMEMDRPHQGAEITILMLQKTGKIKNVLTKTQEKRHNMVMEVNVQHQAIGTPLMKIEEL